MCRCRLFLFIKPSPNRRNSSLAPLSSLACVCQGEDELALRQCYEGVMRDGEVIRVRDTVLLRSGPRKKSLPYVAKISALWEDPKTGTKRRTGTAEWIRRRQDCLPVCVCVCVCVLIRLLRRADDEPFLVLSARAHTGRQRSQHTL